MSLNQNEVGLLQKVVEATNNNGVFYASASDTINLIQAGFIEANAAMVDSNGGYAHRATAAGIAMLKSLLPQSTPSPSFAGAQTMPKGSFPIGSGFVAPAKASRRPGGGGRTYPFESMELNSCIFVPATEKRPDPKKSMASTISSANKRFADFNPRRYFRTYRALAGQQFGEIVAPSAGAYIVRVEPPTAKEEAEDKAAS